jgi:hypothetical protein
MKSSPPAACLPCCWPLLCVCPADCCLKFFKLCVLGGFYSGLVCLFLFLVGQAAVRASDAACVRTSKGRTGSEALSKHRGRALLYKKYTV